MMRTDVNNSPAAFTVDIARQAGLVEGKDYAPGTPFPSPSKLVTAKLLGDPVVLTIRVIEAIGFYTASGHLRWDYIAIPRFVWQMLTDDQKRDVIGWMYWNEGGTTLRAQFPHYNDDKGQGS